LSRNKTEITLTTSQLIRMTNCFQCEVKDNFVCHPIHVFISPGSVHGSVELKIECLMEKQRGDN